MSAFHSLSIAMMSSQSSPFDSVPEVSLALHVLRILKHRTYIRNLLTAEDEMELFSIQ